ncbi:MAG: PAS domain S-box protein, partial [Verrucomicrobiaceae bacterium]
FDEITALAAQICGTPVALITLLDGSRQWCKSRIGFLQVEMPREDSFCTHALAGGGLLVVPDATEDDRFRDNPLVKGREGIRFYAGAPLLANGAVLGTLCVMDRKPRELDDQCLFALEVLGRQVMMQIQSRHDVRALKLTESALLKMLDQRELREHEQRHLVEMLTVAQEVGKVGSWETDVATLDVTWSAQTHRIFETDPDSFRITHHRFLEFVHEEDRAAVDEAFFSSLEKGDPRSLQHRIVLPDGRVKHVEERWQTFHGKDGKPERVIGTCQDITQRKLAEDERDRLFNLSLDMLCVANFHGRFEQVNPAWTECLGWTAEELIGGKMNDFIHPDDQESTVSMRAFITAGNPIRGFENRYRCKDGSYRWLSWNVHPVQGAGRVFSVARDITERKKADDALRASEATMATAQAIAHFGSWELELGGADDGGPFLHWSEEMFRIAGLEEGAAGLPQKEFFALVHPDDREPLMHAGARAIREGGQYTATYRLVRPGGEIRIV